LLIYTHYFIVKFSIEIGNKKLLICLNFLFWLLLLLVIVNDYAIQISYGVKMHNYFFTDGKKIIL